MKGIPSTEEGLRESEKTWSDMEDCFKGLENEQYEKQSTGLNGRNVLSDRKTEQRGTDKRGRRKGTSTLKGNV